MLKWFSELDELLQSFVALCLVVVVIAFGQGVYNTVNHYLDLKYKPQVVYVKSEDTSQQVANSNTGS